jgi:hypothetical protein
MLEAAGSVSVIVPVAPVLVTCFPWIVAGRVAVAACAETVAFGETKGGAGTMIPVDMLYLLSGTTTSPS